MPIFFWLFEPFYTAYTKISLSENKLLENHFFNNNKVNIAINTRLLIKDKIDGIGRFTYETTKHMVKSHPEITFYFLFDQKFDSEFIFSSNVVPLIVRPVTRHPFLWYIWFEYSLPLVLKKKRIDLFLSPDGHMPLSSKHKSVVVIHDINFFHYPNNIPYFARKYYNYYFPKFAKKASRIATVSEFSKQDIVKNYNIDANKIDVVYNGANNIFKPISNICKAEIKKELTNDCPYFLFVGSLSPRKNIENLLISYEKFRNQNKTNIKLLIVGSKLFKISTIENIYNAMKYKAEVIFTGRISDKKLVEVYGAAHALVFIPYFEGFGIPILEAMKSKIPVVTSNVSAMPEIGENAVLLVNPFSINSISEGLKKIAFDNKLRNNLIKKSEYVVKKYSWQKTSDLLWKTIEFVSPLQ